MKIPLLASKINLSGKGLKEIPTEIFQCRNLKKLDLSNNELTGIPPEISKLKHLKSLDLSGNKLTVLMSKFFNLSKLETLILNNNRLKSLPRQISGLVSLKKLSISGNLLTEFPIEINALENLESLNIGNNQFQRFPGEFKVDNLKELWLNGNPVEFFSARALIDGAMHLKALYCFSSLLGVGSGIDPVYAKLKEKKGNCLNDLMLLSLKDDTNIGGNHTNQMKQKNTKSIFISYSHADQSYLNELLTHLKVLDYENLNLKSWDDTQIQSGEDWEKSIEEALSSADISILLISTSFLGSSYVRKKELPKILDSAKSKGAVILPIIIRLCRFEKSPLAHLQTVNPPNKPLNDMTEAQKDKIYYNLCERIEEIVKS